MDDGQLRHLRAGQRGRRSRREISAHSRNFAGCSDKNYELNDALALYIENAAAETRTKPYRQRVYVLRRQNGKIIVEIHKISKPEDFINAHKNPKLLESLTLERLTHEQGCDMTFQKVNSKLYKGSAGADKTCKSTLRGATHTVSNTEITPTRITNLDQGFDDQGNHKWGPPPGVIGHIFVKRK